MSRPPARQRGRGGRGGHEPRARIRTREARALELATLGWSQHQIAADLGITQAAVSKLLKRVELRLLRELADQVERLKVRQTLRLERLYAEALHAWEASKADTTRRRQRQTQGQAGSRAGTLAELVVENQHGDPRYLDEARKALADHRKVWGLEAPQQFDVRTSRNPYAGMTEEALREALARQTALIGEAAPAAGGAFPTPAGSAEAASDTAARETSDADDA